MEAAVEEAGVCKLPEEAEYHVSEGLHACTERAIALACVDGSLCVLHACCQPSPVPVLLSSPEGSACMVSSTPPPL